MRPPRRREAARVGDNRAMTIEFLTPAQALERVRAGALLIDVREAHERAAGHAQGALGVARSLLEAEPFATVPSVDTAVVLICQMGGRSTQAARALEAAGFQRLASVVDEKLATVVPPGRAVTPQAMLLAAMALANDLAEERARGAAMAGRFRDAFGRILERVDAVLEGPSEPASNGDGASDRSP